MTKTKQYQVLWIIDIEAETPFEAAIEAKKIQSDPDAWANVFHVKENGSAVETIIAKGLLP